MSERIYWNWFTMTIDQKKDLSVVVVKCLNSQWAIVECKVDSGSMPTEQAEAQAVKKNMGAIRNCEHVSFLEEPRSKTMNVVLDELRELRVRLDALEQHFYKLEQDEKQQRDGALFIFRSLRQRLSRLEERTPPSHPVK